MNRFIHTCALLLTMPLLLVAGCGQVVGADCIDGRDACNGSCCPLGFDCEDAMCVPVLDPNVDGGVGVDAGSVCPSGQVRCGDECVELASDDMNCGACGVVCGDNLSCEAGACESTCDSDEMLCASECVDTTVDDDHCGACGVTCSATQDCVEGSCVTASCGIGTQLCGAACVDTDSDLVHCGDCDNACGAGEICNAGNCQVDCDAPRIVCDGVCIDPRTSADHCGACDAACESNTCIDSVCRDDRFGHLVLIGHDYSDDRQGMNRLIGGAALIPLERDIEVLAYEGDAEAASVSGVRDSLTHVASATDRTISYDDVSAELVPVRLPDYDVFLVHSQHGASDAELRLLGFRWRNALLTFLRRGGVIVVTDAGGSHAGTYQLLETASLAQLGGRDTVTAETALRVVDGADAIAREVPVTYRAEARSASFRASSSDNVVVSTDDASADPVVFHWIL